MPISRAFIISLKNIKIRLGRSIITASGVFLGIVFLVSVFAQGLVQWPLPAKDIAPGYVRLDGEFEGPGDYEIWNPVTLEEADAAGISKDLALMMAAGKDTFNLSKLVESIDAIKQIDESLPKARTVVSAYRKALKSIGKKADDDFISWKVLRDCGVPNADIKRITKGGKVVVADVKAAFDTAIARLSRLEKRQRDFGVFRTIPKSAIDRLSKDKARTLANVLQMSAERMAGKDALTKTAHRSRLMLINTGGRRMEIDLRNIKVAEQITMVSGDIVFAPDAAGANRQIWLVKMSLLVCTIGITNAMLMAVTERFREIGTMKCLGALDRFIVEMFLFESMLLGIIASAAGAVVGFLGTVLIAAIGKGFGVIGQIAVLDVLKLLGIGIAAGCLVTVIAMIFPAIKAAQMPPAAALRTEV